jgi:diguanylate cyclase (GGDEF)-like protein/PAS domain S-box-containing protein
MNFPLQAVSSFDALLNDRERMLDSLMGNLDGMVYCCLIDPEWTMVFVSDGCIALTGYKPEDILYNRKVSYEGITLPEDRARVRDRVNEAIARNGRFDVEYRILNAQGQVYWVWERGVVVYGEDGQALAIEGFVQDITDRKLSDQALREVEARYRSIFENAIEGIFQTSPSGRYLNANPALARIYGYETAEELIAGLDVRRQLYVVPQRRDDFVREMDLLGHVQNFESQVFRKDGSVIWISENAREVKDDAGRLLYYEGTVEDITERKRYEEQIQYQATHDILTGLPNRSLLSDRLQQAINSADRYGRKVAVAFLDLDHFKHVNDSLGHQAGDQLLVEMAGRLVECVRDCDTVVRLGGDEFVVLLSSFQRLDDISQTMQRILEAMARPCTIGGVDFVVSGSIGVGVYPEDGPDANTLLKNADSAMYQAKQTGRNNFQFFTPELNAVLMERLEIERRLRYALEREEFVLHYQPKLDLVDGRINGAEALIRWQPPGEPMVPPSKFIPIAEETGLIDQIGQWALVTACRQQQAFSQFAGRQLLMSVNVSPRQFQQGNLADMVGQVLLETGADPRFVELEITESTLAQDGGKFIKMLHELKKTGVKLAVDDFGTGYSSMAYLKDFPVDRLKIDKGFVSNLEQEPANEAILRAVVALGHSLGLRVIAEGVETGEQREFLKRIGCDELQGFWFSKPLAADGFERLLADRRTTAGRRLDVVRNVLSRPLVRRAVGAGHST